MDPQKMLHQPANVSDPDQESEFAKLIITAYEVDKFDKTFSKIGNMTVTINPESYQSKYSSHSEGGNKKGTKTIKLANGKLVDLKIIQFREEVSFDLWFDSTGAIPESNEVKDDITTLQDLLVKYNGSIHSTNYTKLQWGSMKFVGQLQSLSIDFLLFNAQGDPLRAKASLSFSEMQDAETRSKIEDDQSPDLTHLRQVRAGDNLPLMCYRIYKDPHFYLKVADFNELPNLMNLKAGQELEFPPLEK